MKTTALWHLSEHRSTLKHDELMMSDSLCLISSEYSLISTGTEKIVASGKVPPDLSETMRVPFMQGEFSFPLTYGYSLTGKVLEGPSALLNKNVHIMHPHQSLITANTDSISIIPDDIPVKRAVLVSNMETIINGLWDSGINAGDKVLVAGFGIIGALLCLVISKFPGTMLYVLEPMSERRQIAKSLGFDTFASNEELTEICDLAFNTSYHEDGLQACIDKTGYEGIIIELSWFGNQRVNLSLGQDFHSQRKRIISSQVSQIPSTKANRWDYRRRKDLAFSLLKSPVFDNLLTHEISFKESPRFFELLRNNEINQISTIIKY